MIFFILKCVLCIYSLSIRELKRVLQDAEAVYTAKRLRCSFPLQANKPAIIESKDGKYPPISAEDFVRESLRAIYVKTEA